MTRRTIKAPIVRIHTADDDYLQTNAASLHEAIKPEISLIAGKGGTTADGSRIYNNSQVKVIRGDNASAYTFATQANGELSSKSLFFGPEDAASSYPKATANVPTSGKRHTDLDDARLQRSREAGLHQRGHGPGADALSGDCSLRAPAQPGGQHHHQSRTDRRHLEQPVGEVCAATAA